MVAITKKTFETLNDLIKYVASEKKQHEHKNEHATPFLFRGQKNACWPLKTTLERFFERNGEPFKEYPLNDYDRVLNKLRKRVRGPLKEKINALRSNTIQPTQSEIPKIIIGDKDIDLRLILRHYGFPSPLLDWTRSLDIALFFCFS